MKAYKASYNGICRDFKYEVGQTYEMINIEICKRGFHACKRMVDTLYYYDYNKDFVLFEVDLLGHIIEKGNKLATDKIKIVRVVPPEEYEDFKVDDRRHIVYMKHPCGIEIWNEYDINNNCIYYKHSNGNEWWSEYDERNNCIHYKHKNNHEWWREYDLNNNCIKYKDAYGRVSHRKYSEYGELLSITES